MKHCKWTLYKWVGASKVEIYLVEGDSYFFFDRHTNLFYKGLMPSWKRKKEECSAITETSELEILIFFGPEIIETIRTFDGKGALWL